MGKNLTYEMFVELTDMNTGHKFTERIKDSVVTYPVIVDLIEAYMP